MPVWLVSLFFNKYTWIALGAAALGAWLYFAVIKPYEHMKAEAARVPGLVVANGQLSGQIGGIQNRLAKAIVDLQIAQAQRQQAVADLTLWNAGKDKLFDTLKRMSLDAAASRNPICLPTPDERKLWNDTLARLTGGNTSGGSGRASGQVSEGAGRVH